MSSCIVSEDGKTLVLDTNRTGPMVLHAIWLRDNSHDDSTRSPQNGQRLISLTDLPEDICISSASKVVGEWLEVVFKPEKLVARFRIGWLEKIFNEHQTHQSGLIAEHIALWGEQSELALHNPDWHDVCNSEESLRNWLLDIQQYGIGRLCNAPTESGDILKIAALFGYVRETNYGKWFEVRNEVKPINLAYTGMALPPHTDNPYRDPLPTMQILHCLENSADGGESIVVDGFNAARELQQRWPESFKLLSGFSACFEYAGADDVHLKSTRPILELSPEGVLKAVRYNNRSISAVVNVPADLIPDYYEAMKRFERILYNLNNFLSFKLNPGECFVVDNTRVLHSRTAFTGAGSRWLQGCYPDLDGMQSTLRVLNRKLGNPRSDNSKFS
ncbi:MAG: TauD/TfdA family dioxygenase [Pseudomonadota bacterium]